MSQFRIKNGLIIDNGGIAVTGSISSTAGITGSFSGSIAGFPTDVAAFSSSLSTRITATEATSSAYVTASGSLAARLVSNEAKTGSYATTGSNVFTSNQTISGSLTTTGTITAQTLVVQTITSSVDFVTGSARFGSNTGNTHQFTGSLLVSGSGYVNGNVGIGNSSPNYSLDISGSSNVSANNFYRYSGDTGIVGSATAITGGGNTQFGIRASNDILFATNGATERMRITSSGSVGIGTTSPDSLLTVGGSSGNVTTPTALQMDNTYRSSTPSFDKLKFYLFKGASESYGLGLGGLSDVQYWAGSSSTGTHVFYTSQTERMRVTSDGKLYVNVGQIYGGSPSSDYGALTLYGGYSATPSQGSRMEIRGYEDGAATQGAIISYTNNTERMRINNSGNIGIGTTSPQTRLDITSVGGSLGSSITYPTNANGITVRNSTNSSNTGSGYWFDHGGLQAGIASARANTGDWGTDIRFFTHPTATSNQYVMQERMRILADGSISIGMTSSPYGNLSLKSNSTTPYAGFNIFAPIDNQNFIFMNHDSEKGVIGTDYASGGYTPLAFLTSNIERMRITSDGNSLFGWTSNGGGKVSISSNVNGLPATSGTSQSNAVLRLRGGDNAVIDMGLNSINTWIQATDLSSLGTYYNLLLNPRGGNVGIGTTSPAGPLHIYKSSGNIWMTLQTGTAYGYVFNDGTNIALASDAGTTGLKFLVNRNAPDNSMSISSGGQVLINTTNTTSGGVYHPLIVKGTSNASQGIWVEAYSNDAAVYIDHSNSIGKIGASYRTSAGYTPLAFETGGYERMRITSAGEVYIATTASDVVGLHSFAIGRDGAYNADVNYSHLALVGASDSRKRISMGYDTVTNYGYLACGQYGVQWTSFYLQKSGGQVYAGSARIDNNSDIRVKDNIQPITGALDTVLSMTGKKFHLLDEPEEKIRLGFIAQDLQGVVDELVIESDRTLTLPSGEVVENVLALETWGSSWAALLVEAIKELKAENDTLKEILQRNNIQ